MKNKIFQRISHKLALFLSVTLLAGCGNAQQGGDPTPTAVQVSENAATPTEAPEPTEAAPAKINDDGRPIADYYEYVNGDWLKEQEGKEQRNGWREDKQQIYDRVKDILENTDITSLSEEDGLYRLIMLYREITDTEDAAQRIGSIRAYLKPISAVTGLNDLYKLYADPRYSVYNYLLRFEVMPDDYGYNEQEFSPLRYSDTLLDMQLVISEGKDTVEREQFLAYADALGFSEQRTLEMISNAMKIAELIDGYYDDENVESGLFFADAEDLDAQGVTVPVIEILEQQKALARSKDFLAQSNVYDTLKKLYVPENVPALKDFYLICALNAMHAVSAFSTEGEAPDIDLSDFVTSMYMNYAVDLMAREYMKRYMGDGVYESAEALVDELRKEVFERVKGSDWLGKESQSAVTGKFVSMSCFLGNNGHVNEFKDLQITGDSVEDLLSFGIACRKFRNLQLFYEDESRVPFNMDSININAYYNPAFNAYVVGAGVLCDPHCAADAPYEERLGYLGALVAHEMGHGVDPKGIVYDREGYYEPWLSEDEQKEYDGRIQKIIEYFDGMEIEYGRKLDGELVKEESFADLFSIKLCLQLLEKREDADYDLFFRAFAEYHRQYVTEANVDGIAADEHLPGRQRINCILAQFDKFYEVYEIDESSPYYVPAEERLKAF